MELVEGLTLADRIIRSPIPLVEALPIAKQVCEALEYAQERGIVHRDLKPANVKIRNEGTVKLLDFGLAKALEGDIASGDVAQLSNYHLHGDSKRNYSWHGRLHVS
jgi:eukaryotic-like serine/threonine-protein kinase